MAKKDKDNHSDSKTFDEYMLATLERSCNYLDKLSERSYNAVQLFITLLTALSGGLILTISTVDDQTLKWSIVTFILLFVAGYSALTYLWLIHALSQQMDERMFRFFLEKYFRDKNPSDYDKYGLSELFNPYHKYHGKDYFSYTKRASSLGTLALGLFSSTSLAIGSFSGLWLLTGQSQTLLAVFIGVLSLVVLMGFLIFSTKKTDERKNISDNIYNAFHKDDAS